MANDSKPTLKEIMDSPSPPWGEGPFDLHFTHGLVGPTGRRQCDPHFYFDILQSKPRLTENRIQAHATTTTIEDYCRKDVEFEKLAQMNYADMERRIMAQIGDAFGLTYEQLSHRMDRTLHSYSVAQIVEAVKNLEPIDPIKTIKVATDELPRFMAKLRQHVDQDLLWRTTDTDSAIGHLGEVEIIEHECVQKGFYIAQTKDEVIVAIGTY